MNETYIPDFGVEATPATFAGVVVIKMKKDHKQLDKEIAKLKNRIRLFEKARKNAVQYEKKKGIRK